MVDPAELYRRCGWWTGEALADRFARHVAAHPDAPAVVDGADRWTAGRLWDAAGAGAEQLATVAGGEAGRRVVLIHLPNGAAWIVSFLTVLRAGHVPATSPITTTGAHLAHALRLTAPLAVITCERHRSHAPLQTVQEAAAAGTFPALITASADGLTVRRGAAASDAVADVPSSTAHLMLTSSTTGPPKAVSHSDDSLATLNRQFADRFGLDGTTPIFMPSPLGHSVGAIHGARLSLYLGAPLVLQDDWDPREALRLVDEHGAAFTAAATPFLVDLLNEPWAGSRPKLAPLGSFLCGGAHVPPSLIERCGAAFPHTFVTPLWGMTEGGLTTCVPDTPRDLVRSTVGIGLPDLELRVVDGDGVLREEGRGELAMRGPGVFNGYYGQPELYRELIVGDGFFRTGDLAQLRSDGYVVITGRLKDLIVRGGVNISPVDTENILAAHPDVQGVAVIGWPDDRLGERLCAVVRSDAPLDLGSLLDFCERSGLPRRYWPERLEIVGKFPTTAAGKIRKQQLSQELLARAEARMSSARLGDIEVNYRVTGSGPAVVLLHGLAEDHTSWHPVLEYLGDWTTYAVDLRGHGATTAGTGRGTLEQLGDDLERFLGAVTGPATVVGFSLGGTIALETATRGDTALRGVVAVATSSVVGRAAAEFFTGRVAQIVSGDREGFAAGLRADTAAQIVTGADVAPLVDARLAAVGTGAGYANAARAMIAMRSTPLNDRLDRVGVPVEVVGADGDTFCPRRAADILLAALPDGRYHEIAGAGHLVAVDQPASYGRLLARLLEGLAR